MALLDVGCWTRPYSGGVLLDVDAWIFTVPFRFHHLIHCLPIERFTGRLHLMTEPLVE